MERVTACMSESVHQMTIVFDMAGWNFKRHGTSFAMACTNQLINIVQKHYPTSLKKALLINVSGSRSGPALSSFLRPPVRVCVRASVCACVLACVCTC